MTLSLNLTSKNNVQLWIIWLTAFPLVTYDNVFLINTSLTSHMTVIAICLSICSTYWSIYFNAYNVACTLCCGLVGNTVSIEWTSHVSTRTCYPTKGYCQKVWKIFLGGKMVWIIFFFSFQALEIIIFSLNCRFVRLHLRRMELANIL